MDEKAARTSAVGVADPGAAAREATRRDKVAAELARYDRYPISIDASGLPERDKAFVREILAAGRLVEELNLLQAHPQMLAWAADVQKNGTDDDRALLARYQMPWCVDDESPECCALPSLPARDIGAYHWPEGMTDEEFAAIGAAPNAKELLSNFTVVRRAPTGEKGGNAWIAVPFAQDPLFGPRMKGIAAHLRNAMALTDEASLKTFLASRAAAFEEPSAFPWDASDYDWILLDGRWELTIGPYEVYKNPRQVKARFQMYFGEADAAVTKQLAPFKDRLQEMEERVADLVGRDVYPPRKLDPRIAIRAVRVWMASGDGRRDTGATAAYHLPNRGPSVDEGLYKKVMLVNHMEAFAPIMKRRAEQILAPGLLPFVRGEADVLNTTFHEFAHGFGAHDELEITRKDGSKTNVHGALKDLASLLEELKADVLSAWLVAEQVRRGWISEDDAKARYVSHLMHVFGLLQYPLEGTYPRMVATQLAFYLEHGAVAYDPAAERWSIDFAAIPVAVEALAKAVATIQLTGDYEGGQALVAHAVTKADDGYRFSERLRDPLTRVKQKFQEAGIKSVSMTYDVTGL